MQDEARPVFGHAPSGRRLRTVLCYCCVGSVVPGPIQLESAGADSAVGSPAPGPIQPSSPSFGSVLSGSSSSISSTTPPSSSSASVIASMSTTSPAACDTPAGSVHATARRTYTYALHSHWLLPPADCSAAVRRGGGNVD